MLIAVSVVVILALVPEVNVPVFAVVVVPDVNPFGATTAPERESFAPLKLNAPVNVTVPANDVVPEPVDCVNDAAFTKLLKFTFAAVVIVISSTEVELPTASVTKISPEVESVKSLAPLIVEAKEMLPFDVTELAAESATGELNVTVPLADVFETTEAVE